MKLTAALVSFVGYKWYFWMNDDIVWRKSNMGYGRQNFWKTLQIQDGVIPTPSILYVEHFRNIIFSSIIIF